MLHRFVLAFVVLSPLVSCKKTPAPALPPPTASVPTGNPVVRTYLTVNLDSTVPPRDTTTRFGVSDTIHGIIQTQNAREGASLLGRWYYMKNGEKIAENGTRLAVGTNLSHFDLINESKWMVGQYKLIVMLDNVAKDSAQFSIVAKR